jgi:hypothetical protein
MAEERWRCRCATKVDVFNQQIGRDGSFFSGATPKDSGIVADACDQRFTPERRRCDALSQRSDEIKFAFGGTTLGVPQGGRGGLFVLVFHP